jgi:hypothetical protein
MQPYSAYITLQPRPFSADITEGCGRVKGCYRNPPSCREEACDIVVTWREMDGRRIEFELSADSDGWVALGLSDDKIMVCYDFMMFLMKFSENNLFR